MSGKLVSGGVSPKMIVALVALVVIAAIVWGVKWTKDPQKAALPAHLRSGDIVYQLWCPECQEEFPIRGNEVDSIPKQGEGPEALRECPKCKKFAGVWDGKPTDGLEQDGAVVAP